MKKRFIVSTNFANRQQHETFKAFLNGNSLTWWHWLAATWLIIDYSGQWNAISIRDLANIAYPNLYCLVIEVPHGDSWAGWGTTNKPRDMFEWMRDYWDG